MGRYDECFLLGLSLTGVNIHFELAIFSNWKAIIEFLYPPPTAAFFKFSGVSKGTSPQCFDDDDVLKIDTYTWLPSDLPDQLKPICIPSA
jgi:hypothetical protein